MAEPVFRRLAIIGLGLIGSSVARAAQARGTIAAEVVAHDSSPAVLDRVRALGIADRVEADLAAAVAGADCVMLCAPVGAFAAHWCGDRAASGAQRDRNGHRGRRSSRSSATWPGVLRPDVHLVPAHPMAGTEYSGPDSGFGTLFENRWCLVTPLPDSDPAAVGACDRAVAPLRRRYRGDGPGASRPGRRDRQPSAPSDRLHDLRQPPTRWRMRAASR